MNKPDTESNSGPEEPNVEPVLPADLKDIDDEMNNLRKIRNRFILNLFLYHLSPN